MHSESLTSNTKRILESLSQSGLTKDFYLAGGSALALHLGHRFSVDLDWFAEDFSCTPEFRESLSRVGKLVVDQATDNTLNGSLNGVKISFFAYPYPLISDRVKYGENVHLAGLPDISAMKLDAAASRGSYKDFIDIYFLLEIYSLKELLEFVRKKFKELEYNEAHLLKSLSYFEDVKGSPRPTMIKEVDWAEVKKVLVETVQEYFRRAG